MKNAPTEYLPGQAEMEEYLKNRRATDPLPGTEQPFVFEQSVQSLYLDEYGREVPNPLPLAPPIGYKKHVSIAEQMRQMIRQVSHEASMAGAETEDEANDFEVGEDMDPHSPWENDFEIDPAMETMIALQSRPPAAPAAAPSAAATPVPTETPKK